MKIDTMAKQVQDNLKKEIPEVYPQRYMNYHVNSANYNVIIHDIETYWNQEARFREGFYADDENKTVTIPNFFAKINGIYKDKKEYVELVKMLRGSANTITMRYNKDFYNMIEPRDTYQNNDDFPRKLLDYENNKKIAEPTIQNVLSGKIYCFEILKTDDFTFEYLTSDKKQLLLDVIKKIITENPLKFKTFSDYKKFLSMAFSLEMEFITMINNFDYGLAVPKVVYYDENISLQDAWKLYMLNEMAVDIAIISPSGKSNVEKYFDITNLSLGYYDAKFELQKEVVTQEDKNRNKTEFRKTVKNSLNEINENFPFWWTIWVFLGIAAIVSGYVLHASGTTNTIIQVVVLVIEACIMGVCLEDVTSESGCSGILYFISVFVIIVLLGVRFVAFIHSDEGMYENKVYKGYQIIEEDVVEQNGFIVHQKDDGVMKNGNSSLYYYLENNSSNTCDIMFEIWVNNSRIYRSINELEPFTYVERIPLGTSLPQGDVTMTVKYYDASTYNKDGENTPIAEKEMTVHVMTLEEIKENSYGYEISTS